MISEIQAEQKEHVDSENILYLREQFQDRLTDGDFTVSSEEAQQYLDQSQGNVNLVIRAYTNVAFFIQKEERLGHKYQQDELVSQLVPAEITKELSRKEERGYTSKRDEASQPVKLTRSQSFIREDQIEKLKQAWDSRVVPHDANWAPLTTQETEELLATALGSPRYTLQAMTVTGRFVRSRKYTRLTRAETLSKTKQGVIKELRFAADRGYVFNGWSKEWEAERLKILVEGVS